MKKNILFLIIILFSLSSCSVSYKFTDASLDYSVYKTLQIKDFQNQAALVYSPLAQLLNEHMKDVFTQNTKLNITTHNPDMEIEGEVVEYDLAPLSVKENGLSSQTRLTLGIRFRYKDSKKPQNNKEETISAYRDFPSDKMLNDVQDQLVQDMIKEIVDQIFNHTMSNW